MSLITTPQETKQYKLMLVLIIVILIIIIVVYFGFFRSASVVVPIDMEEPINGITPIGDAGAIEEDFHFLENPRFQNLEKYGEWPIETGKTGRENPFNPPAGSAPSVEKAPEKPVEGNLEKTTSDVESLTIEDLMKLLEEEAEFGAE